MKISKLCTNTQSEHYRHLCGNEYGHLEATMILLLTRLVFCLFLFYSSENATLRTHSVENDTHSLNLAYFLVVACIFPRLQFQFIFLGLLNHSLSNSFSKSRKHSHDQRSVVRFLLFYLVYMLTFCWTESYRVRAVWWFVSKTTNWNWTQIVFSR